MITKKEISYSDLADKVGSMVLFNNHSNVDTEWYSGLLEQPLMREKLDAIDAENEAGELDEHASVLDFEIYQSYAITPQGASYLINHTAEIVSYSELLGLWFWHITHFGTGWNGVYTTITEWDYTDDVQTYYTHEEMTSLIAGY